MNKKLQINKKIDVLLKDYNQTNPQQRETIALLVLNSAFNYKFAQTQGKMRVKYIDDIKTIISNWEDLTDDVKDALLALGIGPNMNFAKCL